MTMHGGKVHYDKKKLKYTVKEKSGNVIDLYAQEDGFVRVREASRTNVEYMSFGDFYEYYKSYYINDIFKNISILYSYDMWRRYVFCHGISKKV